MPRKDLNVSEDLSQGENESGLRRAGVNCCLGYYVATSAIFAV